MVDNNRSILENEIITRILRDDDTVSLSMFLLQTGIDYYHSHYY